ncbi:MAG: Rho termination factor N-terminal domain-containing protein [Ornithinimicrobium sp.]
MNAKKQDDPGPSIKDREVYEAVRDDGASKAKAAAIANAAARDSREKVGERGGSAGTYDDWTVEQLRHRARELDIEGRSSMNKDELITALRDGR